MSATGTIAAVVADTDVVSSGLKRDRRQRNLYRPHLAGRLVVISFMTVAELYRWPLARRWGQQRVDELGEHLARFVIYQSDEPICRWWAAVVDQGERDGRPIAHADAWVAATALRHGLSLVTNNPSHFAGVSGLRLISEAPGWR